jgi:hypothetical protein
VRFRLSDFGSAFSTRLRGREVLHALEAKAARERRIEIDFAGTRHVSSSFADEFAGALFERVRSGDLNASVSLENVPPNAARVIDATLRRRGLAGVVANVRSDPPAPRPPRP